jgi:hypothetical protein
MWKYWFLEQDKLHSNRISENHLVSTVLKMYEHLNTSGVAFQMLMMLK